MKGNAWVKPVKDKEKKVGGRRADGPDGVDVLRVEKNKSGALRVRRLFLFLFKIFFYF